MRSIFGLPVVIGFGLMLVVSIANSQQGHGKGFVQIHGRDNPEAIPLSIPLYGFFGFVTAMEADTPGSAAATVRGTIGIADEQQAAALAEYMRVAWLAGQASSAARKREFCSKAISTREDLREAMLAREQAHDEELDRLIHGAARVVDAHSYGRLIAYGEQRRASSNISKFDPETFFAENPVVDVAAEIARRCD